MQKLSIWSSIIELSDLRFHYSSKPLKFADAILQNALDRYTSKRTAPNVVCSLIHNPIPNATASFLSDQQYEVRIYDGIFDVMDQFFPTFSRGIDKGIDNGSLVNLCKQKTLHGLVGIPGEAVARIVYVWITHFLVLHETAHIVNGHLDYLALRRPQGILFEANRATETNEDNLMFQAMELHADATAVIAWIVQVVDDTNDNEESNIVMSYRHDHAFLFWTFLVAVSCLFKILNQSSEYQLWDLEEYEPSTFNRLTHPPSFLRILSIGDEFQKWIRRRHPCRSENLFDIVVEAFKCAELWFTLDTKPKDPPVLDDHRMNAIIGHRDRIYEELFPLCKQLESFKYGGKTQIAEM